MAEQIIFSEDNFSKIIEFDPIGIVIVDNHNKWLLTNKRFCEIVNYKKSDWRANFSLILPDQDGG